MAKILQIVKGDYYPYLDDTCNIRIIDRSTHELSTYDFSMLCNSANSKITNPL